MYDYVSFSDSVVVQYDGSREISDTQQELQDVSTVKKTKLI